MRFESNLDTSIDINETDSGRYTPGYSDVLLDEPGRFQIDRVGHPMGDDGGFPGDNRLPGTQPLGNFGMNVFFLTAIVNEERPRFEAQPSMALAEFGRRRAEMNRNRSPGASCRHPTPTVDDVASLPLNRPVTTATDDTTFGDGFGATILLICAVWNRKVFLSLSTSASDVSD